MTSTERRCDVVVVGAGLAGLVAADELTRRGVDVRVLEAGSDVGGRVFGTSGGTDTGAEFIGKPHTQLRTLVGELGLRIRPAGIDRGPILWRLPTVSRVSRRPPGSLADLCSLATAWWRLRRRALALDPVRPWDSAGIRKLDEVSLADWLAASGASDRALELSDALVGGFATRPITDISAAHAAWWITAANGLLAAMRSGQQYFVSGGAHQIPRLLAQRLADRIHLALSALLPALTSTLRSEREMIGYGQVDQAGGTGRARHRGRPRWCGIPAAQHHRHARQPRAGAGI
ncbi:flavin monoamine oxidase family protein [Mycolicibacterium novocastrense]|uniref:flavin monoamine oxidase family protein n=1 Tax=Mycolicibacterium novocastrense TaxID=59813 RepID=UPI0009FD02D5